MSAAYSRDDQSTQGLALAVVHLSACAGTGMVHTELRRPREQSIACIWPAACAAAAPACVQEHATFCGCVWPQEICFKFTLIRLNSCPPAIEAYSYSCILQMPTCHITPCARAFAVARLCVVLHHSAGRTASDRGRTSLSCAAGEPQRLLQLRPRCAMG